MSDQEIDVRPVLLRPDNFTPPSRTPWGGRWIRELKARWVGDGEPVGESWELSVEPSFPSRAEDGALLAERIAGRAAWLGSEAPRGSTALLVKLLDAAAPLSVQIHPPDGYSGLAPGEGGKPESWYVVRREPGSGIYLGLAEGADRRSIERALERGEDVSRLLSFVPVEPGDFFVIDAGTAHCIGAGVALVEPQRVAPGARSVTYRYWDWGRRYDAAGRESAEGTPRALHVRDALAVTDWAAPRGEALLARARLRAGVPDLRASARLEVLAGLEGLASAHLRVARLSGSGAIELPAWNALAALTVLEGAVVLGDRVVEAGRTAAVPAAWRGRAELEGAHAILAATPAPA
ncbi:MAG TPA: class I mannose-6-phosphate isomerase [Sandaracinaceae bacterium]